MSAVDQMSAGLKRPSKATIVGISVVTFALVIASVISKALLDWLTAPLSLFMITLGLYLKFKHGRVIEKSSKDQMECTESISRLSRRLMAIGVVLFGISYSWSPSGHIKSEDIKNDGNLNDRFAVGLGDPDDQEMSTAVLGGWTTVMFATLPVMYYTFPA